MTLELTPSPQWLPWGSMLSRREAGASRQTCDAQIPSERLKIAEEAIFEGRFSSARKPASVTMVMVIAWLRSVADG